VLEHDLPLVSEPDQLLVLEHDLLLASKPDLLMVSENAADGGRQLAVQNFT
jgi:hypothetical protein